MAKRFEDLSPVEQLAIKQAIFNMIGEDVNRKNTDSLRCKVDQEVVGNYRAIGAKSYDIHVNMQKVGTYSVRVSKEKPQEVKSRIVVRDPYALEHFIQNNVVSSVGDGEASYAELYATAMLKNFAEYVVNVHGELPDGCEVVEDTIPAQPSQVLGTTLRIDADKVASAISGYLPTTLAGLLGGGEDA